MGVFYVKAFVMPGEQHVGKRFAFLSRRFAPVYKHVEKIAEFG